MSRGLDHGLEHEDPGKDGEGREVIGEIFLGEGDVLQGDDAIGRGLEHAINKGEMHERRYAERLFGAKAGQGHGAVGVIAGRMGENRPPYAVDVPAVVDEAICIRVWDWSETSQTVSLFTRAHGVVRGVAKGSKREKAPFSGGIELLTRGELLFSLKGEGLSILQAWDLRETYPVIRRTLSAFHAAMFVADVTHHALREQDPHAEVFDALGACLRAMGEEFPARAVLVYLAELLSRTGHRPELDADVRNGVVLPVAPVYAFSPREGGLISTSENAEEESRGSAPLWRVRAETVETLRSAARGELGPSYSDASVVRAVRLLAFYFREVFHVDPPSLQAFIASLGTGGVSTQP